MNFLQYRVIFWGTAVLILGFGLLYLMSGQIIERTDFFLKVNVEKIQNDGSDYKKFTRKNRKQRHAISSAEYLKQIETAQLYLKTHPEGKQTSDLRGKIIQELKIDFLVRGIHRRNMVVTLVAERRGKGFFEKEMLFTDPQVGTFPVLLLVPDKERIAKSAVIGLHGHDGSFWDFQSIIGRQLAAEGFPVIMPSFRAFSVPVDVVLSEELYLNGFTLSGLRVYESLLLIKYLKYKGFNTFGIIGHSAGSNVAYQAALINQDIKALIYDQEPDLLSLLTAGESHCEMLTDFNDHTHFNRHPYNAFPHCDTLPGLAYYGPQIIKELDLKVPHIKLNYGYSSTGDFTRIVDFLYEKMGNKKVIKPLDKK